MGRSFRGAGWLTHPTSHPEPASHPPLSPDPTPPAVTLSSSLIDATEAHVFVSGSVSGETNLRRAVPKRWFGKEDTEFESAENHRSRLCPGLEYWNIPPVIQQIFTEHLLYPRHWSKTDKIIFPIRSGEADNKQIYNIWIMLNDNAEKIKQERGKGRASSEDIDFFEGESEKTLAKSDKWQQTLCREVQALVPCRGGCWARRRAGEGPSVLWKDASSPLPRCRHVRRQSPELLNLPIFQRKPRDLSPPQRTAGK